MFLTVIVLAGPGGDRTLADPDAIRAALWRHQHPSGPIEHIRVRTVPGEAHVGILSLTATQVEADAAAAALCRDTVQREPTLQGWHVRPRRVRRAGCADDMTERKE